MNKRVPDNIGEIVQMPRRIKGVGIDDRTDKSDKKISETVRCVCSANNLISLSCRANLKFEVKFEIILKHNKSTVFHVFPGSFICG